MSISDVDMFHRPQTPYEHDYCILGTFGTRQIHSLKREWEVFHIT